MKDVRRRIHEILTQGRIVSLATIDDGGPWVADVLYVHDKELNLYWISRKSRRHSVALRKDPRVAASITLSTPPEKDIGLQIAGLATELPDTPAIASEYWAKRKDPPKQPITNEHAWYRLKPTLIELIDEARFGHVKKLLEL